MGSSGGGGGSSGAVSHSAYLEGVHSDWLNHTGTDSIAISITTIINSAATTNPWVGLSAYNPDTVLTASEAAITAFAAILTGIVDTTSWAALYTQGVTSVGTYTDLVVADITDTTDVAGITNAIIIADTAAFANMIDDEITTKVLPRYRRGMQDINAVISSAFPIGEAVIEGFRDREVAKHDSAMRLNAANKNADILIENEKLHLEVRKTNQSKDVTVGDINVRLAAEYKKMYLEGSSQMLRLLIQRVSWRENLMRVTIESNRIKIVAKKEQTDQDAKIDEELGLWPVEVYQAGANMLAAAAGGTASSRFKGPSQMQSVIGGAMSGAAAGAMVGGGYGAVVGGVLGAAAGMMNR